MSLDFQEKTFGLDISEKTLRLVQLGKVGNKIKLLSYNEQKIEEELIKDGLIADENKLVELIKNLIKTAKGKKINTKFVCACLPEPKTFIKVFDLKSSNLNESEILENIIEESSKHIPYSLDKIYLDWQYIKNSDNKVMIGACPKDIVISYQNLFKKAGLISTALEIEAAAITRAIFTDQVATQESPIMIMDFGGNRTSLIVYQEGYIPFSLSLDLSSDELTRYVSTKLKIEHNKAEQAKKKFGLDPKFLNGQFYRLLEKPFTDLAKQIREAKYFYYEHFSGAKNISKLYLTGGGANLLNLKEFLEREIKIPTELTNPLVNITKSKVKLPPGSEQSFTTAIGLNLRQFQKYD